MEDRREIIRLVLVLGGNEAKIVQWKLLRGSEREVGNSPDSEVGCQECQLSVPEKKFCEFSSPFRTFSAWRALFFGEGSGGKKINGILFRLTHL